MAAADAVSAEMLKAFDESDATVTTVDGDAAASSVAASSVAMAPALACAEPDATTPATWNCTKCQLLKPIGSAVGCPSFICKPCNTKRSTLSQMFGHWPVELFKALTVEQQTEFWRAESKGKVQVQNTLVKNVTDARIEVIKNSTIGQYLPLSVYKTMGYDTDAIHANCKDVEEHEVLGTTYKVDLKSVTTDDVRKKVWADLFNQSGEQKQKAQKKKDNKKRKKSSSASSSGDERSSSNSSSAPVKSVVVLRREACEKRKAEAAARKEEAQAEKAKIAAAAKEAKEVEKLAAAEAKEKTKAKAASQAQYNFLWNAHQGLVAAVEKVPSDDFGSEAYLKATEKVEEGEALIEQSLDALKLKISVPSDPIKAYIQSLKHILSEAQKLGKKRHLKK
jgi:hypothetical protein